MLDKIKIYDDLADLFISHGYHLYLVGGTVRDILLNIPLTDMDAVSDATPTQMKEFIKEADYTFMKYGSVKLVFNEIKFDITTLRKEKEYQDSRHPNSIEFVKDLKIDVKRRDFTINAMYFDRNHDIIDYVGGQEDIEKHLLKMVGDADKRIKEDPLRIIRAIRFAIDYDLSLDNDLKEAILNNIELLDKLNPEKIKQDLKKIKTECKTKIYAFFVEFHITHLMNMIE